MVDVLGHDVVDRQVGIAIRFIRQYDIRVDQHPTVFDVDLLKWLRDLYEAEHAHDVARFEDDGGPSL